MRKLPEWEASHDDQQIPPRIKLRIFERFNGCCAICTRRIGGSLRSAFDHIIALVNGGQHRESNIQLLCGPCHTTKTRGDVAEKSVLYRKRLKHLGFKKPKRKIPYRKFDGTVVFPDDR